jgi:hypothetical protein
MMFFVNRNPDMTPINGRFREAVIGPALMPGNVEYEALFSPDSCGVSRVHAAPVWNQQEPGEPG